MTIAPGKWVPLIDTGDETPYSNHLHVDDFTSLARTQFDIVVVGSGGAGAVAAIEAADRGASVLILKATSSPGGNTQISGGTIRLVDDPRVAVEHLVHLAQGATPRAVIEAFVTG